MIRRVALRRVGHLVLATAVCLAEGITALGADQRPKAAVFDFELIDTSLQGELEGTQPDERRRVAAISDQLRRELSRSGEYQIVDMGPAAARIEAAGYLYGCNDCAAGIARSLGADVAITGTVQKVSNLILNMNVFIRDAATGKPLRAMSVDLRGNTDESWSRGVSYLVRNRLLRD